MKTCGRCRIEKDVNSFAKDKKRKDGLQYWCVNCYKEYKLTNKEKSKEQNKKWVEKNRIKYNHYARCYQRDRKQSDPLFKLKCNLRRRTNKCFKAKSWNKNTKTQEMLGANYEVAFKHIESQFKNGMSWDNHGDWHIDHIIPLSLATTEEEMIKLCHYTNLQPLWAEDNLIKSNKTI